MSWNFLDVFDIILDILDLFTSGSRSSSDKKSLNYDEKSKKEDPKDPDVLQKK
ncbi:hypothetical protein [Chryseobacterium gallinarum]|uniref:hypothetical protein n=1 Tax=Chryseobacterium gallinarum TaxID=1324352 RepID=UPI000AFEF4BA|nr:hypothetical protein [Chryseobacterium gallinarum]